MTHIFSRTPIVAAALVASASILGACVTDSRVSSAMPEGATPGAKTIVDTLVDSRGGLVDLCWTGRDQVQQAVIDIADGLATDGVAIVPATDAPMAGTYLNNRCLALMGRPAVTAAK